MDGMVLKPLVIISVSVSAAIYAFLSAITIICFDMARHFGGNDGST